MEKKFNIGMDVYVAKVLRKTDDDGTGVSEIIIKNKSDKYVHPSLSIRDDVLADMKAQRIEKDIDEFVDYWIEDFKRVLKEKL